jgi:hypothetical protein
VRYPTEWYRMSETIAERFPSLRPAQQRGLALWVYGTILAGSACQNAVIAGLLAVGHWHALRQHLREWLYDGQDKAAACQTEIDVTLCFGPLIDWILSWWQGRELALAIDPTARGDEVVGLTVSVLYRGAAIPIAWQILPANQKGAWMGQILRLLRLVRRQMPASLDVLVMADRGLWSPRLWKRIRDLGWHPLLRLQNTITCQPVGQGRQPSRKLVPGPGHAWVGKATVFKDRRRQRAGTLIVVWGQDEKEPWVLLTDLPPEKVGVWWYGLRVWIELGFRALKGVGWQWHKTRRLDPRRVARHWLVLAVAMLWVLAYGTRAEDAELRGLAPGNLRSPAKPKAASRPARPRRRLVSIFQWGLSWLRRQLLKGRLWRRLWLAPEPWPDPPPGLQIAYHQPTYPLVA